MRVLIVRTSDSLLNPPVVFQYFDDFSEFHCSVFFLYYTHYTHFVKVTYHCHDRNAQKRQCEITIISFSHSICRGKPAVLIEVTGKPYPSLLFIDLIRMRFHQNIQGRKRMGNRINLVAIKIKSSRNKMHVSGHSNLRVLMTKTFSNNRNRNTTG